MTTKTNPGKIKYLVPRVIARDAERLSIVTHRDD